MERLTQLLSTFSGQLASSLGIPFNPFTAEYDAGGRGSPRSVILLQPIPLTHRNTSYSVNVKEPTKLNSNTACFLQVKEPTKLNSNTSHSVYVNEQTKVCSNTLCSAQMTDLTKLSCKLPEGIKG